MIYIFLFTLALTYFELRMEMNVDRWGKLLAVYSLIGFVLSLLLVFRTNTAYDRWWEGRKKWGEMVNNTRNLATKISVMIDDKPTRDYFARMIGNYAYAVKEHLREGVKFEELDLTDEEKSILENASHLPNIIDKWLYAKTYSLKKEGKISEQDFIVIDVNLKALADILGACERIRNTPIPYSYSIFLKKFIFIYVTTIPLALVGDFGYYSSLIAMFIFYVLVSMEILAEEIEDPFGLDDNDLPTDDLCAKIKMNAEELLH